MSDGRDHVVATAGHVDHGKSTLVRALTGMEPDRWAEERRRGLTIDLGFAWTELSSGRQVAFVDVPGHERFLGNMLAGLGPAPIVCFVVAADEGWQRQSSDHRDAVAALGIDSGLIALTRADRAPDRIGPALAQARAELAGTGLRDAPAVVVSAVQGTGMDELRLALDEVLAGAPEPPAGARVRLWVDRSFSVRGAGTVVTGTLAAGTLHDDARLALLTRDGERAVTVRGLHSRNRPVSTVGPTNRVAVNLRGIDAEAVHRGDAVTTPGAWPLTGMLDVRRTSGTAFTDVPVELVVHVGTASVPARLRPFDADHARVNLERELPVVPGDRLVLRYPGGPSVLGGAQVLDVDPAALDRRGDGGRHAEWLAGMPAGGDARWETIRRGAVREDRLHLLGLVGSVREVDGRPPLPQDVRRLGGWWVHAPVLQRWRGTLREAAERVAAEDPLAPGLSRGAAVDLLALADPALVDVLAPEVGLEQQDGFLRVAGRAAGLGPAEQDVAAVERQLAAEPFAAPEAEDLAARRLGPRELAAAERQGRLLRLTEAVVLLPSAPALAMRELARLDQPFTTSQARQALGTTRRVAVPLLEHLDGRGWTRRLDAGHREVAR